MPGNKNIRITIDDEQLDIGKPEDLPLAITYSLEDRDEFQTKTSSKALSTVFPATLNNARIANSFHNPSVEDFSPDNIFRRNRRVVIGANGHELLSGVAFLKGGKHTDRPTSYEYDFYGNNGDWVIDLKESPIYDFVKDIKFLFDKNTIINSWNFDGRNPQLPFVFAPVKYAEQMDTGLKGTVSVDDFNMTPEYMKPSLSKYWILFNALKSRGYQIKSDFLDSDYFRRQVMPWTWGNFLTSDGTKLDQLDFLAKSSVTTEILNQGFTGLVDSHVDNTTSNGAFDNSGTYSYTSPRMKWTYPITPTLNFGKLTVYFHLNTFIQAVCTANSDIEVRTQWFKNGQRIVFNGAANLTPGVNQFPSNIGNSTNSNGELLLNIGAPVVGRSEYTGASEQEPWFDVVPGDVIECQIYVHTFKSGAGICRLHLDVDAFEIDYFRIPLGGNISFDAYTTMKNYLFLDFLGGLIDEFNLCIQTDPISKIVYIEPEHQYSLINDLTNPKGGYFNGNRLDWTDKQDFSKESEPTLYSDYEREVNFMYKEDSNDGMYKIVSERNQNKPGAGKYVFPDRFKTGKSDIENRFFSPTMHYDAVQWKDIAADYPTMVSLVPENISNTSREEAQHTFLPKSCYYKGMVNNMGWMFDGQLQYTFPYMFSVNYKPGGQNDPILSYCDELIGPAGGVQVTGYGLIRRFYRQRLEIMRNGQWYKTWFHLNNNDIMNFLHREYIVCQGQLWEIIEINNYNPITEDSTEVLLRRWVPIKA